MNTEINNHCQHFVQRKKRFCRMTVKDGNNYCGEHEPVTKTNSDDNATDSRIPCPLDPTHTCYANKLSKHLKVCNAKITSHPPFIQKGINLGYDAGSQTDENRLELSVIDTDDVVSVINRIKKLYYELLPEHIEYSNHRHILLNDECNEESYGANKRRHLIQTSALAGQLQNEKFLLPKTSFVEFGGGKGQMTYWLAKISEQIPDTHIVLVDKASHRHKQDNKLENMQHRVHRIRADISDLVLKKLDCVSESENVVGVGKHLCGAATDLAFRCMAHHEEPIMSGIVLAFCCHHRCTWLTYTGRSWMESLGIYKKDFDIMCAVSSWATCGTGLSRERRQNGKKQDNAEHEKINAEENQNKEKNNTVECDNKHREIKRNRFGLNLQEREALGRKTKHVMDFGRRKFLQDNGYNCKFNYYVTQEITPENLCIIARKETNIQQ